MSLTPQVCPPGADRPPRRANPDGRPCGLGLGGSSVVEPGQGGGQGPERPAPVAHGVLLGRRHLGEGAAVAVVGDEHRVVAEARRRRGPRWRCGPRRRPRPPARAPSGQRTRATVRNRARRCAGGRRHRPERARPGAWPRCRRRWRPRRRSGPSARPARRRGRRPRGRCRRPPPAPRSPRRWRPPSAGRCPRACRRPRPHRAPTAGRGSSVDPGRFEDGRDLGHLVGVGARPTTRRTVSDRSAGAGARLGRVEQQQLLQLDRSR